MKADRRTNPLQATLTAAALTAALVGHDARAEDAPPAEAKTWSWDGIYKADLLHSRLARGGVGLLNLRANADAGALFGWDDTTLHGELLWTHGSKPNRRIGTTQGISNLEVAEASARVYATWIEHEFKSTETSVLFGLYDLNSEFYVTDASALLIHPSFGIGIDFSQSGRNGPSIFPNLGLSLRVRQQLGGGYYLQGAIIDGVPGDPQTPGRTSVRLGHDDGALLVTEVGWQQRGADGPMPGHWAVGVWHYTQRSDRIDASDREHNQGFYALAQAVLSSGDGPRAIAFVRTGAANRQVNAVDFAVDAGVLVDQPFGKSGPASFTAGVALARFGDPHRSAQTAMSVAMASHETAFEIGARWQLLPSLAVQPLLQHVWHVAGHRDTNATIVGVRIEWAFGTANP